MRTETGFAGSFAFMSTLELIVSASSYATVSMRIDLVAGYNKQDVLLRRAR